MKKLINGRYVDMTAEEEAREEAIRSELEAIEKSRQLTTDEVLDILVKHLINDIDVDDETALRMKEFYPTFEEVQGKELPKGFKFFYGDDLYKTRQDSYTPQSHYKPGSGTESLFERIDEVHKGTFEDPIPYGGNMEIFNGKYYIQNDVKYLCNRDSGNPLYHDLKDLVGLYVQVV